MNRSAALLFFGLFGITLGCGPAPQPSRAAATPKPAPVPFSQLPLITFDESFWSVWSDGQAELSGYELTASRYGAPRRGTAVTIFVTEPFSETARVKADPGVHPAADELPVIKMNLVKDYQTGIYDYNEMLSVFVGLKPSGGRPAGVPAKVSFSAQEWCGHVYAQLLPTGGTISINSHSYFDGQADQLRNVPDQPDGFFEDEAFLWARGFASPLVEPGREQPVKLLASLFQARGAPQKLLWSAATLARGQKTERLAVPAGRFDAIRSVVRANGQDLLTIWTEAAAPHHILKWESAAGESAVLTGTTRLKYWELNGPGGEKYLSKLGLRARPGRTM